MARKSNLNYRGTPEMRQLLTTRKSLSRWVCGRRDLNPHGLSVTGS